jgi:hypothetical protein
VVTRLGATARDHRDVGLTDNTRYDYRVTATGPNGSASSRVATARTLPAPTTLSASNPTTRTVDLRWSATTGASGYEVERREASSAGFVTVAKLGSAVGAYTDGGLGHSTDYEYRVTATGVPGAEPSNLVRVRTDPPQIKRVWLATDWNKQFRFWGSASVAAPAGARILGVRNVAVGKGDVGLPLFDIEHRSSDAEVRSVEELDPDATTSAFNGQLIAKGSWSLWVSPASASYVWECTGRVFNSTACSTVAQIVLEVTWA